MEAWALLKAGELIQAKLVCHVARELKARTGTGSGDHRMVQDLIRAGRKAGFIASDDEDLVIKLKVGSLIHEQEDRLQQFQGASLTESRTCSKLLTLRACDRAAIKLV